MDLSIQYHNRAYLTKLDGTFFSVTPIFTSEVTIIPTYDTDVLGYWVAENEDALAEHKIDLAPSASRCTINLQDHETSCAAYRLEF